MRGNRAGLRTAGAIALVVGLGGCPGRVPRRYPAPTAAELLAGLDARDGAVRTLRAEAKVDYFGRQGRLKGTVLMLVGPGGRLRFDASSPVGASLSTTTSDGTTFALLDAREDRFFTGPARPCNVARLVGVALAPAEAATVLLGSAPRIAVRAASVSWDDRAGRELLRLEDTGGQIETLAIARHGAGWELRAAELRDRAGARLFAVTHEAFGDVDGVRLPARTRIEQPATGADVLILFRTRHVNEPLDDGAFTQRPPAGLRPEQLACPD